MPDAVRSDTPTATVTVDAAYEALKITVTNPTPTGVRPAVTSNQIYRRETGSTGVWTLVGTVGNNGVYTDVWQRSGTGYDYFVRTDSLADSITYSGTSPTVSGMWGLSANDSTNIRHFPYTDGHGETLGIAEAVLQFVGRTYPTVESGIQESQTVAVNVRIPFSDSDWRTQVEWWRARKRDRQTLLYRDGRGRMQPTRIIGDLSIQPSRAGATVGCTLQRVDYTFATVTVDPAYYQAGAYNDGGNGIYGNGLQGNGY